MAIRGDFRGRHLMDQTSEVHSEESHWSTDVIIAVAIATAFIVVHLGVPGPVPSGADPGGWLAMAKERFGVEVLAARDATYLPGIPLLLGSLLAVADSILAITAAGLISKVALVLAVYVVVRPVGRIYAAAAAVMIGMSGAHGEMYAWGGYPQQLGTALGVIAVFYLVRYLESRRPRDLALAAVAVVMTLVTHNLIGGLLVGALLMAAVHWLYLTRASRREWITGLGDAAILALGAGIFVGASLVLGQQADVRPSLNPTGLTWAESLEHMISEAPIPWLVVAAIAIPVSISRRWSGAYAATVAVGVSWVVTSVIFFLAISEPRALLMTQLGLVMIAVPGYKELLHVARRRNIYARDVVAVLGSALFLAVVATGFTDYEAATDYYRVVDREEIAALDQLVEVSDPDDVVVASVGRNGLQMGWWVQGYAERPTYPGGDVAFLASPQERAQGALANRVFEVPVDTTEVASVLDQIGARFVVVDRRGSSAAWLQSEFARSRDVVNDSSGLVILELPTNG